MSVFRTGRLALCLLICALFGVMGSEWARAQSADAAQPPLKGARTQREIVALLRLADAYYYAESIDSDFSKALLYYSQAADAGSASGKIRTGEMIARGLGTAKDYERGRAILEESAATGDAKALAVLGELYTRGEAGPMDPARALKALEAAAEKGDNRALLLLGDIYQYGRFESPDPEKALDYYKQAAEAGSPYGLYSAGNALVRAKAARRGAVAEGLELLQRAEREGIESAAVAISNGVLYGGLRRPDTKSALALLVKAMEMGNLEAGKELVAIYRDGKQDGRVKLVRRDPRRAQRYFEKLEEKLTRRERAIQAFLLDAANAPPSKNQALAKRFDEFTGPDARLVFRELRSVNPAIYLFLSQSKLKEIGLFSGKVSGKYGASTSKAIFKYCRRTGTRFFCSHGPFSVQSAELLSYTF
ncbi:MAG: tetratricopeptide repeat protein [Rhizobiaceae bacterium]